MYTRVSESVLWCGVCRSQSKLYNRYAQCEKKMSILIKKITVHPRHLPHPFLVFSSPRTHKSLGEFLECGFVSRHECQFCIAVACQAVWRFFILREGKTMMPFVYFFPEGALTGLLVRGPLAVITLYRGTLSADDGMRC